MKVGARSRDGQDLGDDDLDVVGADARGDHGDAQSLVRAGDGVELAMAAMDLDILEHLGDAVGAVGVARQQDVVGDLSGSEVDVVLAVGIGQRDAADPRRARCLLVSYLGQREGCAER